MGSYIKGPKGPFLLDKVNTLQVIMLLCNLTRCVAARTGIGLLYRRNIMGRPLNKKYFANTNYQDFGTANTGGESAASVAVSGTFSGKTPGTYDIPASVISAPQITGGVKPTMTLTYVTDSTATVAVVTAGSGYTGTVTISGAGLQSLGGAGTGTIVLTATMTTGDTARQNGIKCEAQIGAGSEVTTGDIIKQVNGRSYKVQTSDGTAVCKLVTTEAKDDNQMSIKATDSDGNTYFVAKLTSRKVVLVPAADVHGGTTTIGSQFASGTTAKWTFGAAVEGTTVTIENQ